MPGLFTRRPMKNSGSKPPSRTTTPDRRDFFHLVSDGIYGAALTSLLCEDLYGDTTKLRPGAVPEPSRRVYDLKPRDPHFKPKAKAVIQFLMNGAPSQMDLFDPKPVIEKHQGRSFVDKAATETTVL